MDSVFPETSYTEQDFLNLKLSDEQITAKEFEQCTFKKCSFSECSFTVCKFIDCAFEQCHLSLVTLANSTFLETTFKKSTFVGIDWSRVERVRDLQFIECEIAHSGFSFVKAPNVVMRNCVAKEVDFMEADCTGADFSGTDFEKSKFLNTNLTKANFKGAYNYAIGYNDNTLKGAKFSLPEAAALLQGLDIVLED